MNRCTACFQKISLALCLAGAASLAPFGALAQGLERQFPEAAMRGWFQITTPPEVLINGKPQRLAPGARIKNPNNMLVMSGNLIGQQLLVHYTRDMQGQIQDVWILNPAEAQKPRAGLGVITNIRFASDADKP